MKKLYNQLVHKDKKKIKNRTVKQEEDPVEEPKPKEPEPSAPILEEPQEPENCVAISEEQRKAATPFWPLPFELSLYILSFLTMLDLCKVSQVNVWTYLTTCEEASLWKRGYSQEFSQRDLEAEEKTLELDASLNKEEVNGGWYWKKLLFKHLRHPIIKNRSIEDVYHIKLSPQLGSNESVAIHEATRQSDSKKFVVRRMLGTADFPIKYELDLLQVFRRIRHPLIIKHYESYVDETKNTVYTVLEYPEKGWKELFDCIVEKGYYAEKESAELVKQILSVLEYLHSRNIAHRTFRPETFLCYKEGDKDCILLWDWGMAIQFDENVKINDGVACGVPGYVCPEILEGVVYDSQCDMWTLGVITYILLSGYPPFYADNQSQLFAKVVACTYDFNDPIWTNITDIAKDFIIRLLVKDPTKRMTAKECLKHEWLAGPPKDI